MTPAGTPQLIDIRAARVKAATCINQVLHEACSRRCRHCRDRIGARRTGQKWLHGENICEASDLREFMAELNVAEDISLAASRQSICSVSKVARECFPALPRLL